jgi:hypothetical protein
MVGGRYVETTTIKNLPLLLFAKIDINRTFFQIRDGHSWERYL